MMAGTTMQSSTNSPRVSFIVTGYNEEKYIREAVLSAFHQDYPNLQVVLSDNASTDRTFEIMRELAASAPAGIDVVLNRNAENLHLSGNLQKAAELCDGEVIVRGCGDDVFARDRATRTLDYFEANPKVMASACRYQLIGGDGQQVPGATCKNHAPPGWEQMTSVQILQCCVTGRSGSGIYGCAAAYRKCLFTMFPPLPSGILWDDQMLLFRATMLGGAGWMDDQLVQYRTHGGNSVGAAIGPGKLSVMEMERHRARLCSLVLDAMDVWERDLAHARKFGYPVVGEAGEIEQIVGLWRDNRTVVAKWWEFSLACKLGWLGKSFHSGNLLPKKFMFLRILPPPLYALLRRLAS